MWHLPCLPSYSLLSIYIHVFATYFYKEKICANPFFRPVRPLSSSNLTYGRIIQFIVNIIIIIISAIFSAGFGFLLLVDILEKGVYSEKFSECLFEQSSHPFSVINMFFFFKLCNAKAAMPLCHCPCIMSLIQIGRASALVTSQGRLHDQQVTWSQLSDDCNHKWSLQNLNYTVCTMKPLTFSESYQCQWLKEHFYQLFFYW